MQGTVSMHKAPKQEALRTIPVPLSHPPFARGNIVTL
jgi:hypothetical protein